MTAWGELAAAADWARLSQALGVKVIHVSERDTQVSSDPKREDEFVNTWSVEGFYEEGIAPAEMGWGTHERMVPPGTQVHEHGPMNQIASAGWAAARGCARGCRAATSWAW